MGSIRQSPEYGSQGGVYDRDKEECIAGHPFTPENTRVRVRKNKQGQVIGRMRICIPCARERSRYHRIMNVILEEGEKLGILVWK